MYSSFQVRCPRAGGTLQFPRPGFSQENVMRTIENTKEMRQRNFERRREE